MDQDVAPRAALVHVSAGHKHGFKVILHAMILMEETGDCNTMSSSAWMELFQYLVSHWNCLLNLNILC